jgi:hypothetical protein
MKIIVILCGILLCTGFGLYAQDSLKTTKQPPADTSSVKPDSSTRAFGTTTIADSSIKKTSTPITDTTRNTSKSLPDSVLKAMAKPKADTAKDSAKPFFNAPYYNVGFGWGLGAFPLYSDWQQALPDSANAIMPINPDTFKMTLKEPVNSYNIILPIYLSYTPYVYRNSSVAFEGSFLYFDKNMNATLKRDSGDAKIEYQQDLRTLTFSIGAMYRRTIDPQYFKVDNIDKTSFIAGIGIIPIITLDRTTTTKSSGIPDSVMIAVHSNQKNLSATGMGITWKLGICAQQLFPKSSGMEVSLVYQGRFSGFFRTKDGFLLNNDINPSAANPYNKLSFVFNALEIQVTLCSGKKERKKEENGKKEKGWFLF